MTTKKVYATFHATKDYMYNAERDGLTGELLVYFDLSEHIFPGNSYYTLRMYSPVKDADETFYLSLEVHGSPVFVSGYFFVNYDPSDPSDVEREIKRKKCCVLPPEQYHDIFYGDFDELFKHRDTANIKIQLVLETIPDKSVIALPCPTAYEFAARDTFDVAFAVDGDKVPAHRGFLAMMSPVFQAMFTHDTKESQTGVIEITDFDLATVTNAMNLCYGNDTGPKSVLDAISISRFADKYDIQSAMKHCDEALATHLTKKNFAQIAKHAWEFNKDGLKQHCIAFFKKHTDVVLTPGFAGLSAAIMEGIVHGAVSV
uniref:BTB domain-containing protein n=1 Tax=Panagrellus redivivus TaxID=6233 RepID=A0A7E4V529_PANRE